MQLTKVFQPVYALLHTSLYICPTIQAATGNKLGEIGVFSNIIALVKHKPYEHVIIRTSRIGRCLAVEHHLKIGCHRHYDIHEVGVFAIDSLLSVGMKRIGIVVAHIQQR